MSSITSIKDYLNEVSRFDNYENIFYRGQSDNTFKNISCGIVRDNGFSNNESKIIYDALRGKSDEFEDLNLPIEHLSKMQHYGIPTRLIDVSLSPLIALYFAVEDINNLQDGEVFIFVKKSYSIHSKEVKLNSLISELDSYELDDIKKRYTEVYEENITDEEIINIIGNNIFVANSEELIKTNMRLSKQQGTFIVCGNEVEGNNVKKKILSIEKEEATSIIKIPFEYKESIKRELDHKYKINEAYVYPELSSFARYLREKYKEENISLEDMYEIAKEDDESIGRVKRVGKYIILKRRVSIGTIKKIVNFVVNKYKDDSDLIWIYVARNKEDLILYNWVVQAIWCDKNLNKQYIQTFGESDECGISWKMNRDFVTLNEFYDKNVFDDNKNLFIYNQKSYYILKEIYNKLLEPFSIGDFKEFVDLLKEYGSKIRNEYFKFGDYGHSRDIKFDKYLDNYQNFAAYIDNLIVCLNNSNGNEKSDQYLYSMYMREISECIKIIDKESLLWIEKLGIEESDFININYVKKEPSFTFKPTIPINEKGLDVHIDIEVIKLKDNRVQIKGKTNLYDKASLMLNIRGEKYGASNTVIVNNNQFISDIFSDGDKGLKKGKYVLEVTLSIPSVQNKEFVDKAGIEYENLIGDFIDRTGIGPSGEYRCEFYI